MKEFFKEYKFMLITIVLILIFTISLTFLINKKTNKVENNNEDINNINIDTDKYNFLNEIETDNLVCTYNYILKLYRCNNIINEKYDSHNNLIEISTKDKKYTYKYLYDTNNNVVEFSFEDVILSILYDNLNKIDTIIYKNENDYKKIEYEYNNSLLYYTEIPNKITVKNINNEIEYYITFDKSYNEYFNIIEKKYNNKNELMLLREYDYYPETLNETFFQKINYIPEAYYINNPLKEINYLFANHGNIFNNFTYETNNIQVYETNNIRYELKNEDEWEYFTNSDYKKHLTNGNIDYIVTSKNNKEYKYEIKSKKYKELDYYEILNYNGGSI